MLVCELGFSARSAGPAAGIGAWPSLHLRWLPEHLRLTEHHRPMNGLDRTPLGLLTAVALWLAVSPIVPEPHLVEKLRMLAQGNLVRPLDIFDLLLHAAPLLLLIVRLWRRWGPRSR